MTLAQLDRPMQSTYDSIDILLTNYRILINDASYLAAEWSDMADEERTDHRSMAMSDWSKRYTLGKLYQAGQLSPTEVVRLAELDRKLLEKAKDIEVVYGPSLSQLISRLVEWGTPLTEMDDVIQLNIPGRALPRLSEALASST